MLGHSSLKEAERYTRAFDRKKLAARAQAKVAAANNVVPLAVAANAPPFFPGPARGSVSGRRSGTLIRALTCH